MNYCVLVTAQSVIPVPVQFLFCNAIILGLVGTVQPSVLDREANTPSVLKDLTLSELVCVYVCVSRVEEC